MGAWGTGIFSDDVACDVRDSYRERVADGMEGPAATDDLLSDWKIAAMLEDDDDVMVFWIALAATQWKIGRLEDRVRDKAIAVIDSGKDLERWEEAKQADKRRAVLLALKEQLSSPQPAAKEVRVQRMYVPPWSRGDCVAYRLKSGQWTVLWVEGVSEDSVRCSILHWVGPEMPDEATILGVSKRASSQSHKPDASFYLITDKKKGIPYDRLTVLPFQRPSTNWPKAHEGGYLYQWEQFDFLLESEYDLK